MMEMPAQQIIAPLNKVNVSMSLSYAMITMIVPLKNAITLLDFVLTLKSAAMTITLALMTHAIPLLAVSLPL
jgi:hypothetical protein